MNDRTTKGNMGTRGQLEWRELLVILLVITAGVVLFVIVRRILSGGFG